MQDEDCQRHPGEPHGTYESWRELRVWALGAMERGWPGTTRRALGWIARGGMRKMAQGAGQCEKQRTAQAESDSARHRR
eukprot:5520415-Pleurochrysis_carterae.AAC.1